MGSRSPEELRDALLRGWVARYRYRKAIKNFRKCTDIFEEMLATERTYVDNIRILVELYVYPLRWKQIITEEALEKIFSNVEQILSINTELLWALEERYQKWSPHQGIGDIFFRMTPFFKMYYLYMKNYDNALATLDKLEEENTGFKKFLLDRENRPECSALNLLSRLILPIQRLPRYQMLLEDLKRRTPKIHSDFQTLSEATALTKTIAEQIDKGMQSMDRRVSRKLKIEEVQHRIAGCPNLVEPHREFIREGQLKRVTPEKRGGNYVLFLFNDIIVCANRSIKKFAQLHFKKEIPLLNLWVNDTPDLEGEFGAVFELLEEEEEQSLLFAAKNDEEKKIWVDDIQNAINLLLENNPDAKATRNKYRPILPSKPGKQGGDSWISSPLDRNRLEQISKEKLDALISISEILHPQTGVFPTLDRQNKIGGTTVTRRILPIIPAGSLVREFDVHRNGLPST